MTPPKIVFHIGMGKTGTTSIQQTLLGASDQLATQNARYLGMWFGILGDEFRNFPGLARLAASTAAEQKDHARVFANHIRVVGRRTGATTFIHSNESIFEQPVALDPFFRAIREEVEAVLLCYVRPPHDWLPSAFNQWNIRHKTLPGPLQPFAERARALIAVYEAIRVWREGFGDVLQVRRYDSGEDVVADFADAVGITLAPSAVRHLERTEAAENLLRGLFNDRFADTVMPAVFDRTILVGARIPAPSVDRMIDIVTSLDSLDAVVAERRAVFEYIREAFGIDLLRNSAPAPSPAGPDGIRARLIDYLVEITLSQGIRIHQLERRLEKLGHSE